MAVRQNNVTKLISECRRNREQRRVMPDSFRPSKYSVLLGRGKSNINWVGNRRLRILCESHLTRYASAKNRVEKSAIVSAIVDTIMEACPMGGFYRRDKGQWLMVEDEMAREKVGCILRDCLGDKYKSSTKNKVAKRKERKAVQTTPGNHCENDSDIGSASTAQQLPFTSQVGECSQSCDESIAVVTAASSTTGSSSSSASASKRSSFSSMRSSISSKRSSITSMMSFAESSFLMDDGCDSATISTQDHPKKTNYMFTFDLSSGFDSKETMSEADKKSFDQCWTELLQGGCRIQPIVV